MPNLGLRIAMKSFLSPFIPSPNPTNTPKNGTSGIKPPPPEFDFRREISATANSHPELTDLVKNGTLTLISKKLFGPVPEWRREFVEPEEIWLVGTSHLSQQSALDVERVIRAVKPDNVVVELCRSRAGIMYTSHRNSNMFSLTGPAFLDAVARSLNLGGQTALALRLLLALFSSKMSSDADRPFGDEFRAARKASEEIGAQLVLGDRPVEITLKRAWNSLQWSDKLGLIVSVFRGITSPALNISRDNLKDQEMDESPFQLYEKLSLSYPSLLQPLIHERDTYLAWSLKRSKAVNKCKRVVGVIGKGHLNGVIYALISDLGDLRFRDLCGDRSNRWVDTLLKGLARDTVIGIVLWGLYEQLKAGF